MQLTVAALKGGVGKTTTAVLLALQLHHDAPTVLIDADPQGSASTWRRMAGDTWPADLTVLPWTDPATLPPHWGSHVVIDTGPGDPQRLRAALTLSDTALIPIGSRRGDVVQLRETVRIVEDVAVHRPLSWGVLLTLVRLSTRAAREAPDAIERDDFPLLRSVVPMSATLADAFGTVPDRFHAYADVLTELTGVPAHA